MRIYNRNNRKSVRYFLRILRSDMTPMDYWTLAIALTLLLFVMLWPAAAMAQQDPCDACIADWSWAECPCLPLAPEPPVSSLSCIPVAHIVTGCDKAFLPMVGRQP